MPEPEIPWIDLSHQTAAIRERFEESLHAILASGAFSNGPETALFEEEWSRYVKVRHAIGVSDGTTAILLLLRAVEIGAGDEVLTSPTTYFATAEAIALSGARPTFADVDPGTGNLDPSSVEASISANTRAIFAVHLGGRLADVDALADLARSKGIHLFEDAAQAHGARWGGGVAGGLADAASFSFYPTKNLGAFGEGGAITTNDDRIAARVRALRDHGQFSRHKHDLIGHNARLDSFQAAALRLKLPKLDAWNAERRALADLYRRELTGLPIGVPSERNPLSCVYHLFTIRSDRRDELARYLAERHIGSGSHYPTPIHLQPAFASLGYSRGAFPNAEHYADQQLSLPLYPGLPPESVQRVSAAIRTYFDERRT